MPAEALYKIEVKTKQAGGVFTAIAMQPEITSSSTYSGHLVGSVSSCSSVSSGSINYFGSCDTHIIKWQRRVLLDHTTNPWTWETWIDINNTSTQYNLNANAVEMTTQFRAIIDGSSSCCGNKLSAPDPEAGKYSSDYAMIAVVTTPLILAANITSTSNNVSFGEGVNVNVFSIIPTTSVKYYKSNNIIAPELEITSPYNFGWGTTTTVTVVAENACSSSLKTFTVSTGIVPQINCPPSVSLNTSADGMGDCTGTYNYTLTWDGANATTTPTTGHYIGNPQPDITYTVDGGTPTAWTGSIANLYKGAHTIALTATSVAGTANCNFTVTIVDNEKPVISTQAIDMTVECNGAGNTEALNAWLNNHGSAVATDNCDTELSWSNNFSTLSDECGATGSATVIFTATDDDGNASSSIATFTIVDTTNPTITAASNSTVECDGHGNTAALNAWLDNHGGATASDDCSGVTWSNNFTGLSDLCGATGAATVKFTATDACGNASSSTATFTIVDTTNPTITAASNSTVECDGHGNTAALNAWLDNHGGATASDDCSGVTWSNNFTGLSDLCGATGAATVKFTATDACGNASSSTATFTIVDTTNPTITAASNSTVECDGHGNTAALNAWLDNHGGATASDDCSGVTWSNNFTGLSDLCGATGAATVKFTATDACGNASSSTATFTIVDTTNPTITAASNSTVECDGHGNTAALNAWLDNHGGATASDDCSGVTWSNNFTGLSDLCGATGAATVKFTATDACGNASSSTATFTIVDTTNPTITAASNSTVECDGHGNTAALNAWLDNHGGATASDDCSGVTWSNNFTGLSDLCGATGAATVKFTATDACGNASSSTATFTIVDTTNPTITAASNSTVECDGHGNTAALNAWLDNHGGATASDDCSGVTWSNNFTGLSDLCGATGAATVKFTATDACGNASSSTATFTIVDTTNPTITAASNSTVECDGHGNTAALNAWLDNHGGATASDDCSGVTWSNNFTGLSDLCGATGAATVKFTATDACGNASSSTATFTIVDTTNPTITAASNSTVECDGHGNTAALNAWLDNHGGATASDDCSGVTWSNNFTGLSDLCGATGAATVKFTATDACGNASSSTATFTIVDTTNPTITAASNSTVECDGHGNTAALNAWLDNHGGATASDDCSGVTWSNNFTGLSDLCGATGAATVKFTATDACGNASSSTATFTIVDTTNPTITAASNSTVECDGHGNTAALNAWLDNHGGATASDDCSGVTWSNNFTGLSDLCGATGAATVKFTATDACGNASSSTATFTIVDTTNPTITAASNSTVECDGHGNTAALNAWLDNHGGATASDDCSGVTWSNNFTGLSDLCGATGAATVKFTATDACGNASSSTATFTIVDTTNPTITAASNSTVECDGHGNTAALNAWLDNHGGATASDDCSGVTWSNNFTGLSDLCGATGAATVKFTATDACGNASSSTATFTIVDTQGPAITPINTEITCGGSINIETTPGECTYIAGTGFNVDADDVCGDVALLTYKLEGATTGEGNNSLATVVFNPGTTTVTWTAVDACDNTSTCSFNVVVKIKTKTTVYTSADAVHLTRYMDKVTLYAEVETNCFDNTGYTLQGNVQFYLDNTPVGDPQPAYVIPFNEQTGVAKLRATLIYDIAVLPKWTTDPNSVDPYKVWATFTPTNSPDYLGSTSTKKDLKIYPREATPFAGNAGFYTGPLFAWTTSSNSSTGTVVLSATITDKNNSVGDVRGARVTFWFKSKTGDFIEVPGGKNLPVGLVNQTDGTVGTAAIDVQLNLGTKNSDFWTVAVQITGGYFNNYEAAESQTTFTLAKPMPGGYIVGGGKLDGGVPSAEQNGQINNLSSSGWVRGAAGVSTDFSFEVTYNSKMTNPQGKAFITFSSWYKPDGTLDGTLHNYKISSNAISTLVVGVKTALDKAIFTSKANLEEHRTTMVDGQPVTTVIPIEGGAILDLRMTDVAGLDNGDLGIQLNRKAGGIWFSSKWVNTNTAEKAIEKGNIFVSTAPQNATVTPSQTPGKKTASIIDPTLTEAKVNVFPNPFTEKLFFEFASPMATDARLEIFSITGAKIATLFDAPIEAGRKYKAEYVPTLVSSQMVIYRLTMNGETRVGKMVYNERQ